MDEGTIYRFRKDEDGVFRSYIVPQGTRDGQGSGDEDQPYVGFDPSRFGVRQMTKLLLLRGRVLEARLGRDPLGEDLGP